MPFAGHLNFNTVKLVVPNNPVLDLSDGQL
jgi:hypothetical protein